MVNVFVKKDIFNLAIYVSNAKIIVSLVKINMNVLIVTYIYIEFLNKRIVFVILDILKMNYFNVNNAIILVNNVINRISMINVLNVLKADKNKINFYHNINVFVEKDIMKFNHLNV